MKIDFQENSGNDYLDDILRMPKELKAKLKEIKT